jgi:hypothetical protein
MAESVGSTLISFYGLSAVLPVKSLEYFGRRTYPNVKYLLRYVDCNFSITHQSTLHLLHISKYEVLRLFYLVLRNYNVKWYISIEKFYDTCRHLSNHGKYFTIAYA